MDASERGATQGMVSIKKRLLTMPHGQMGTERRPPGSVSVCLLWSLVATVVVLAAEEAGGVVRP